MGVYIGGSFDIVIRRLVEQHDRFLSEIGGETISALLAENARLSEKLLRVQRVVDLKMLPPPIPPFDVHPCPKRYASSFDAWTLPGTVVQNDCEPAQNRTELGPTAYVLDSAHKSLNTSLNCSLREAGLGTQAIKGSKVNLRDEEVTSPGNVKPSASIFPSRRAGFIDDELDSNDALSKIRADAWEKKRSREIHRLQVLFNLPPKEFSVSVSAVCKAIGPRCGENPLDTDTILNVVGALRKVTKPFELTHQNFDEDQFVSIHSLVDFIIQPAMLEDLHETDLPTAKKFLRAIRTMTVDDVVRDVTQTDCEGQPKAHEERSTWMPQDLLGLFIALIVLLNFLTMGISIDEDSGNVGWVFLEAFFLLAYATEVVIKLWRVGPVSYFCGKDRYWNWCDFAVTLSSLLDFLVVAIAFEEGPQQGSANSQGRTSRAIRNLLFLKVLRIVRVVRLIKMMRSPILTDISNMLNGFVIGIPALFWVLTFFAAYLYLFGIVFRLLLGPHPGQDYLTACGDPDDLVNFKDEACPLHYLFGEMYFNTVRKSMFTSFRFMLGDFSSYGGHHIIMALSNGYGPQFDAFFVIWMILCVFGLFNIITGIFCDSTSAGLKHNDLKRKYMLQYERNFVGLKLRALLTRVKAIYAERERFGNDEIEFGRIEVDEEHFEDLMRDPRVAEIMQDLDIDVSNPRNIFATFDSENIGRVTWPTMLKSILKLRGEPHKADFVASYLLLKSLHQKIDRMRKNVAEALVDSPIKRVESNATGPVLNQSLDTTKRTK